MDQGALGSKRCRRQRDSFWPGKSGVLLALEEAGDRPSVAGLSNMERALAIGEAGEEEAQCCNAVVAYNIIWVRVC